MIKLKPLVISLLIPLGVGGVSAFVTRDGMDAMKELTSPPLTPPAWLFPVVWTILFILMGIASYLVYMSEQPRAAVRTALTVYGIQLAANFFWSILFFNLGMYLFSFVWILLLWSLIFATLLLFYRISKPAGYLLLPYLLWVSFAAYLNFGIFLLN